ncbi:MAG: hypothetical protein SRB2_00100 [Desulfobacteraceae bacterium Eth-SRB2]|nr:MAG: hypothetical protein SRB2_00100 [Desulfobacteraceae bacterium Eth-SRB2]
MCQKYDGILLSWEGCKDRFIKAYKSNAFFSPNFIRSGIGINIIICVYLRKSASYLI